VRRIRSDAGAEREGVDKLRNGEISLRVVDFRTVI
jgi:hypothetical protein